MTQNVRIWVHGTPMIEVERYRIERLSAATWSAFAALVERQSGFDYDRPKGAGNCVMTAVCDVGRVRRHS